VSKKRKKKPGKPARSQGRRSQADLFGPASDLQEQVAAFQNFAAFRGQIDAQKAANAALMATDLVADLVKVMADQPDAVVEDALCERLGSLMAEARQAPVDERVSPLHLAEALVTAAEDAAATNTGQPEAWRVLTALVCVLPHPYGEAANDAVARLRDKAAGRVPPPGPEVAGQVLWTRDRYGSRFAVVAPITAEGRPARWYLWDVDTCGHQAFTVHSGFHPTPEAALADWQAGVGPIAAEGTDLAPVEDASLLFALMPLEEGVMRAGGESAEQFAEYYRSKRLGEFVRQALPWREVSQGLNAAAAAVEFAEWLRASGQEVSDELAEELADSWCINDIDAVYATCSPHRVALCVLQMRGFYEDEFVGQLVVLLPDWIRWLAERNATPPELADRCLAYAHGETHPQIDREGSDPHYLARVIE
jgi:hypothetical protein